jgi:hypothetical protein
MKERGADGAQGRPGVDGSDGDQGIQGIQGIPGIEGPEGAAGNKRGKRLAMLGVGLLILFFTISGYVQSAKNGDQLNKSDNDRRKLIASNERITTTLERQSQLIVQLQAAIKAQNDALHRAGINAVPIPGVVEPPERSTSRSPSPGVKTTPSPSPQPTSKPTPTSKPSPTPSPTPTDTPPTINEIICALLGICFI